MIFVILYGPVFLLYQKHMGQFSFISQHKQKIGYDIFISDENGHGFDSGFKEAVSTLIFGKKLKRR